MRWPEAIIELEREKEQVERETLHGLMLPKQEQVMKEAIHLSLQDSHKSRDNSTGFTINWGELGYPEKKSQDVWFPKSFGNVNYQVDVSFRKSSYANNTGCILAWERVSASVVRISGGTQSSFTGCSYIAVGFS